MPLLVNFAATQYCREKLNDLGHDMSFDEVRTEMSDFVQINRVVRSLDLDWFIECTAVKLKAKK